MTEVKTLDEQLLKGCVLFDLHQSVPGTWRAVTGEELQLNSELSALDTKMRHAKHILASRQFKAVLNLDHRFRVKVRLRYAYASPFRNGIYLMPLGVVELVYAEYEKYAQRRQDIISELVEDYPELKRADKKSLGPLYKEADYPSVEDLKSGYRVRASFVELAVPVSLKKVAPGIYTKQESEFSALMREAAEGALGLLRERTVEFLTGWVSRLGYENTGRPKVITQAAFEKFSDFLATFKAMNVMNDGEATDLIEKLRAAMKGVTLSSLKTDRDFRDEIRLQFERLVPMTKSWEADRPTRKIELEDE